MPEFMGRKFTNERVLKGASQVRWKRVSLNRTSVDDEGVIELCRRAQNLEEIEIVGGPFTDAIMPIICSLPKLHGIVLRDAPGISDAGIANIAQIKDLRVLHLEGTSLTDSGVTSFAKQEQLWCVSLTSTTVSDEGAAQLCPLNHLRILGLEKTQVQGSGILGIHNGLRMSVYLDECPLIDEWMLRFLQTHSLIGRLSMNGTPISDAVVREVAKLEHISDLRISNTNVSPGTLELFVGHPSLISLYVAGLNIDDNFIQRMKSASPHHMSIFR